jgi:hypothetical protein
VVCVFLCWSLFFLTFIKMLQLKLDQIETANDAVLKAKQARIESISTEVIKALQDAKFSRDMSLHDMSLSSTKTMAVVWQKPPYQDYMRVDIDWSSYTEEDFKLVKGIVFQKWQDCLNVKADSMEQLRRHFLSFCSKNMKTTVISKEEDGLHIRLINNESMFVSNEVLRRVVELELARLIFN